MEMLIHINRIWLTVQMGAIDCWFELYFVAGECPRLCGIGEFETKLKTTFCISKIVTPIWHSGIGEDFKRSNGDNLEMSNHFLPPLYSG